MAPLVLPSKGRIGLRTHKTCLALILQTIAIAFHLDEVCVMQQAIEQGGCQRVIAGKRCSPLPDRQVGSYDD